MLGWGIVRIAVLSLLSAELSMYDATGCHSLGQDDMASSRLLVHLRDTHPHTQFLFCHRSPKRLQEHRHLNILPRVCMFNPGFAERASN